MKLRAFHATNYTPQNVAVIVNMFKQGLTDGKYRAEYGSERLMQFEAPLAGTELFIPGFKVDGTNSYFRVANASTWTTTITARLYNNSGSQVGSTYTDSVNNQKAKSFAGNVFGAASGTYTLRIQSTYNVTAAAWHSSGGGHTGVTAQRVGDTDGTGTYLPFYWENHYVWQDEAQYSNTSGSGVYGGSLYKRSDGSFLSNWVFWPWGQYAQASTSFSGYNNELYAKLLGAYPLAVGRFENYSTTSDRILSYNGIAKKSGTWYVPFAPAPVVVFAWQTEDNNNEPNKGFGFAGPVGGSAPSWAGDMNWQSWSRSASHCNSGSGDSPANRFLVMEWGWRGPLQEGSGAYNSSTRMSTMNNRIPSACTGRPLLLFNEPASTNSSSGGQSSMTFAEITNVMFRYRTWPGDLYSPAWQTRWPDRPSDAQYPGNIYDCDLTAGETDPTRTCFDGLVDYWSTPNRLFDSQTLTITDVLDGIQVHFYASLTDFDIREVGVCDEATTAGCTYDDHYNKLNSEYTDEWYAADAWAKRSDALNFPIVISEHSVPGGHAVPTWYTAIGVDMTEATVDRIPRLNDILTKQLGSRLSSRLWFIPYCGDSGENCRNWWNTRLFTNATSATLSLAGEEWFDDVKVR